VVILILLGTSTARGGKRASPLTPPCSFRVIANIGNDWELECNINSPNNRHIVAKLFIK